MHVCHRDNEVYSTKKENHKLVRVEIPFGYKQVRSLLRSMDRGTRKMERTVPIVSYDANYPVPPRRSASLPRRETEARVQAIVEPASTPRRSKHRSVRYAVRQPEHPSLTATSQDDASQPRARPRETDEKVRRGSLYEADMAKPRKEYRVEVREPVDVEARRERRREKERPREVESERGREGRRRRRMEER